jgi:chorismate--pyruvate lyase
MWSLNVPASLTILRLSEPRWLSWGRQRRGLIPADLVDWLGDDGSLTRRLVANCEGRFRVRVRYQGWGRPLASERRALHERGSAAALVREVELLCRERAWVFARTLIPAHTLQGRARRLARLGARPLGEVLFADVGVERGGLEVAQLLPHHILFRSAVHSIGTVPASLWARRALFFIEGRPLLINEVFLPELTGAR